MGKRADQKYCYNCGTIISYAAGNCTECAMAQPDLERVNVDTEDALPPVIVVEASPAVLRASRRDAVLGLMLACVAGPFGVQEFYRGNMRAGAMYICALVLTFGLAIPFLWGIAVFTSLVRLFDAE